MNVFVKQKFKCGEKKKRGKEKYSSQKAVSKLVPFVVRQHQKGKNHAQKAHIDDWRIQKEKFVKRSNITLKKSKK
jgi:hypothetical protein